MDGYEASVCEALRRVTLFTEMIRWVWAVNMIATIVGLARGLYTLAALAAFSWIFSLTAAAAARRAVKHLDSISRPSVPRRRTVLELEEKTR